MGRRVFCPTACFLDDLDAWIQTTDIRGQPSIGKLLAEELGRAKGVPRDLMSTMDSALIRQITDLHIWMTVGDAIHDIFHATDMAQLQDDEVPDLVSARSDDDSDDDSNDNDDSNDELNAGAWTWTVPDLRKGGDWFKDRVCSLDAAIAGHPKEQHLKEQARSCRSAPTPG
jgi:hypothetical protein